MNLKKLMDAEGDVSVVNKPDTTKLNKSKVKEQSNRMVVGDPKELADDIISFLEENKGKEYRCEGKFIVLRADEKDGEWRFYIDSATKNEGGAGTAIAGGWCDPEDKEQMCKFIVQSLKQINRMQNYTLEGLEPSKAIEAKPSKNVPALEEYTDYEEVKDSNVKRFVINHKWI